MANWNTLKAAVADVINANGNQAITGQLLQNVLNNIITNVGENATFAGIANLDTNPGAPDGPVFYLTATAGIYPNFNGIEVPKGEASILLWNNGSWSKKNTGFATLERLSKLEGIVKMFTSFNGRQIGNDKLNIPTDATSVEGAISALNPHITNTVTEYGETWTCQIDGKSKTKLVKVHSDFFGTNANTYSTLAIFKPTGECVYHNNVQGPTYLLIRESVIIRASLSNSSSESPILYKDYQSNDGESLEEMFERLEEKINEATPEGLEEKINALSNDIDNIRYTDVYYFTDKNIVDGVLVEKKGEGYISAAGSDYLIGASYADYYEIDSEPYKQVFVKAFLSGGDRKYINLAVKYEGEIVSKKNISYEGKKNDVVLVVPRDSTLCISVQKDSEVLKGYTLEDKYKQPVKINSDNFKIFNSLNGCIIDDSEFNTPNNVTSVSGAISGDAPHITNTTTKYGTTVTCQIDGSSRTKLVKVRSDFFGPNANTYSTLAIFKPDGECLYNNNVRGVTYILVKDILVIRTVWSGSNAILVKDNESEDGFDIEEKIKELESSINNINFKKLNGTSFTTIGDSLSETGKWQSKFEELSGCHYVSDKELGVRVNKGGTVTGPVFTDCGMMRMKNLASIKDRLSLDFIIYENVNDHGAFAMGADGIEGSIDDNPWMQGSKVDYRTTVFPSKSELDSFLSSNFQSILAETPSSERKKGGYFVFAYFKSGTNSSFRFSVKKSAITDGELKLYKNGNLSITIPVTTSMSLEDIASLIYSSNFGSGSINIIEPNNSVVVRLAGSGAQYTIDSGDTGISVDVEQVNEPVLVPRLFTGFLSEEWEDTEKWKESVSLYSLYKGLIEYTKTEFSLVKFYWMIPNLYSVSKNSSYTNSDGTFNVSAYKKTALSVGWERLRKVIIDVCELYNVPVLDVDKNSNISLENVFSFFKENDVHPLTEGYYRWGETVNSLLN